MSVTFETAPRLPRWLERELPWHRRSAVIGGRRVHFVDEGAGRPVLLMHGNPTWCFLWRKVITRLVPHGVRIVAPDLLGFGLSDKPRRPSAYSLELQVATMTELVKGLGLRDFVVVGQDWGGPVAAGVGSRLADHVHGMVWANTAVLEPARPFRSKGFHKFSHAPIVSDIVFRGLNFPLPLLDRAQGDRRSIGKLERRAYRWPLRRSWNRAGPLGLARMVPDTEEHPSTATMNAIGAWVQGWRGPAELVWGERDPILGRALRRHAAALPQARVTKTRAGHFLQEEVPESLADAIIRVCEE